MPHPILRPWFLGLALTSLTACQRNGGPIEGLPTAGSDDASGSGDADEPDSGKGDGGGDGSSSGDDAGEGAGGDGGAGGTTDAGMDDDGPAPSSTGTTGDAADADADAGNADADAGDGTGDAGADEAGTAADSATEAGTGDAGDDDPDGGTAADEAGGADGTGDLSFCDVSPVFDDLVAAGVDVPEACCDFADHQETCSDTGESALIACLDLLGETPSAECLAAHALLLSCLVGSECTDVVACILVGDAVDVACQG